MSLWKRALAKTRNTIAKAVKSVVRSRSPDDATLEELEELLLKADVPVKLVMELIEDQHEARLGADDSRYAHLKKQLLDSLGEAVDFNWTSATKPLVVMVVGINGSGKTTTCAKLARRVMNQGMNPILGAADTFRAAGSDQLKIWAERIGCDVVGGQQGADTAAVAYDSLDRAMARGNDVVILDTAGRMHTKLPLMEEMKKVKRVLNKRLEGAPQETWLVLDASLGQNAVIQAREFHKAVPLSGVVVAKLDGSAKGGFVFSIARELKVPILYAGLGEGMDDLVPFKPDEFVDALLALEEEQEEPAAAT